MGGGTERTLGGRIARTVAFGVMGAALLATSPIYLFLRTTADLPEVRLEPGQEAWIEVQMQQRTDAPERHLEVTTAELSFELTAVHEVTNPQGQPDNTPWITASLPGEIRGMTELQDELETPKGQAGAGGVAESGIRSSAFLQDEVVRSEVTLDQRGRASAWLHLQRAPTSQDFASVVSGRVALDARVDSKKDESAELPWDVTVTLHRRPQ